MNERFEQMMLEATKDMPQGYYVPGEYFQKFAELIVKECIGIANNVHMCRDGQVVAEDIKKHFGIVYYTQEDLDAAHERGVELAKKLRIE